MEQRPSDTTISMATLVCATPQTKAAGPGSVGPVGAQLYGASLSYPSRAARAMLDHKGMREEADRQMKQLQIGIRSMSQPVETLSGGQRQGVAVARAAAWASKLVIMDEPTAALGVKESAQVLELIKRVRDNGLPVILISHNMPHVFEIADRIHIHRLGKRVAVVSPKTHNMHEVVGIMTGAVVHDIEHPGEDKDHDVDGGRHDPGQAETPGARPAG